MWICWLALAQYYDLLVRTTGLGVVNLFAPTIAFQFESDAFVPSLAIA